MKFSRRGFLKSSAVQAAGIAAIPMIVSETVSASPKKKAEELSTGDVILFQGDSITDAGRNRERQLANDASSFGTGYALMAAASILEQNPEEQLKIYNRGISGNKVYQLADRWQEDCLDLKPALLSILIGVNDYWHKRNGKYDGTVEVYETDFRALLKRTLDSFPNVKLVVCEPFSIDGGTAIGEGWQDEFTPYREAAKRISDEFKTAWVPYHTLFKEALKHAPAAYWSPDGVHPSMAGAQLMAQAWLKVVFG
ncbi:SGNH/GDSL hydrolase family protein [Mangrovibacterium diazotrophicum]|uniref:Lysophospholipase L1-like esterase n=1 Tax=Mangrovibacterium diazotrophicum TaxID=1261403 RepID=A0A419VUP6_9BACT|nr:SGNH/GDSL hydrolase family protein [Mangrovibacterium diazotrophicum]RKD85166.1 lysophospholipase L1-like esterase [Mangrovibacterium diazotrophicum]